MTDAENLEAAMNTFRDGGGTRDQMLKMVDKVYIMETLVDGKPIGDWTVGEARERGRELLREAAALRRKAKQEAER